MGSPTGMVDGISWKRPSSWKTFAYGASGSDYSPLQKLMHWSVLLLCIAQFPTAWAIQRTHAALELGLAPNGVDLILHQVHAVNGWAILILMAGRFLLLVFRGPLPLPPETPRWQGIVARVNHILIYMTFVALVITGTAGMFVTSYATPIHKLLVNMAIALVAIHAAAALWHCSVRRDGVMSRMLPARLVLWRRGAQTKRRWWQSELDRNPAALEPVEVDVNGGGT